MIFIVTVCNIRFSLAGCRVKVVQTKASFSPTKNQVSEN